MTKRYGPQCACGCGDHARPGNRYIKGHNTTKRTPAAWFTTLAEHRQLWLDAGVPYGECLCGCSTPTLISSESDSSRNWVKGEPRLFVDRHACALSAVLYEVDDNGCWIWKRSKYLGGYGQYKGSFAHRHFWVERHGSIPEGLEVHHVCRVRACVNPDHLELMQRGDHRRLHAVLTQELVDEIRQRFDGWEGSRHAFCHAVAPDYGVSYMAIYQVMRQESWKVAA